MLDQNFLCLKILAPQIGNIDDPSSKPSNHLYRHHNRSYEVVKIIPRSYQQLDQQKRFHYSQEFPFFRNLLES
jgi:hypothetical protein